MADVRDLSARFPEEQKAYLEGLLAKYPSDSFLLDTYLETLHDISRSYFGVMCATIPGLKLPLWFRANSSDIWNLRQVFQLREYAFDFPHPPRRILDLGAYVGFAAVYFANRFPNAEIVCVEPEETNFEILRMNTVGYRNIKLIHGAIWHHSTRVNLKGKMGGEAWASVFEEGGQGQVQAYSVSDLLRMIGWTGIDYVKCDIEGAEAEVFSDPRCAEWVSEAMCVSVELHDRFKPGCTETVEAAFPPSTFDRRQSGEYVVFVRRQGPSCSDEDYGVVREVVRLAPSSLRLLHFRPINVSPEPWGFMIIDETTFQLHPNKPGESTAQIEFTIDLSGQCQFSTRILVEGFGTQDAIFSVEMGSHDSNVLHEERQVGPGQMIDWTFPIGPCSGLHRIILATRMAPGAEDHGGRGHVG